jgi:hypothetical protein
MKQLTILKKPPKVKIEMSNKKLINFPGILLIQNLAYCLGIPERIEKIVKVKERERGYCEATSIFALAQSMIMGGECLDDLEVLRRAAAVKVLTGLEIPHPTTEGDFLRRFNLGHIHQLEKVMKLTFKKVEQLKPLTSVTLDFDSSIFPVVGDKDGADYTWNKEFGYHPLFCFLGETGDWLHFWFRRGNRYTSERCEDFLSECLVRLPQGVKQRYARGDSGFYDKNFVVGCEQAKIGFTITADQTACLMARIFALAEDAWQVLARAERSELAEVWYQPCGWDKEYRYLVVRRPYKSGEQIDLFSPRYKYQVVVTNRRGSGRRLVLFHQGKCNVENRIKEVKSGFNLHHLPCGDFFANWVYFWCGQLAYNLVCWLKRLALPLGYLNKAIKTVRFRLLCVGSEVVTRGRQIILRITNDWPWFKDFWRAYQNILALDSS